MKKIILFICVVAIATTQILLAQPLSRDTTFFLDYNFTSFKAFPVGLLEESDRSFLLYGEIEDVDITRKKAAVKFFSNGYIDNRFLASATYNIYAKRTNYGYFLANNDFRLKKADFISGLEVDSIFNYNQFLLDTTFEDAIIRGGSSFLAKDGVFWGGCAGTSPCVSLNGSKRYWLWKVDTLGKGDTAFKHDVNASIFSIVQSKDSLIILAGDFTKYDTTSAINIIRINQNGKIDTSFKNIFSEGSIRHVIEDENGKLLISGTLKLKNSTSTRSIVRLLPNGLLDTTFNNNASILFTSNGLLGRINTICKTSDNGLLMGGSFISYDGFLRGNIVKTNANGYIDINYFNGVGIGYVGSNPSLGLFPIVANITKGLNDTYFVTGQFNRYDGATVKPLIKLKGLTSGLLNSKPSLSSFALYPNPSNGSFSIKYKGEQPLKNSVLIISDQTGRKIKNLINPDFSAISINDLVNGVYFISLKAENAIFKTEKLVVQH